MGTAYTLPGVSEVPNKGNDCSKDQGNNPPYFGLMADQGDDHIERVASYITCSK